MRIYCKKSLYTNVITYVEVAACLQDQCTWVINYNKVRSTRVVSLSEEH